MMNSADFLQLIQNAHDSRKRYHDLPLMRLFHGLHDGLDGFYVDRLQNSLVVQTQTAALDALQSQWLPVLNQVFNPEAILLKNHNAIRFNRGLTLSDSILYGGLTHPQLVLHENGCVYSWDTNSPHPFPLIDRKYRQKLAQMILNPGEFLIIDPFADNNLPDQPETKNNLTILESSDKRFDFVQTGTKLRELRAQRQNQYDGMALNLCPLRPTQKFNVSLFHLFFQMLPLLKPGAKILFTTEFPQDCLGTLKKIGKKTGDDFFLTSQEGQDFDFPVNLATMPTPIKQVLVLEKKMNNCKIGKLVQDLGGTGGLDLTQSKLKKLRTRHIS